MPAFALLGGVAIYLLGHVAFRWRHVHTFNWQRLILAALLLALVPAAVAVEVSAIATMSIAATLMGAMIVYETRSYGDGRDRVRHQGTFTSAR